jgi:hypothetical protein
LAFGTLLPAVLLYFIGPSSFQSSAAGSAAVNVKNSNGYLGENQATAKDLVFEFTVKVAKFTAVGNF